MDEDKENPKIDKRERKKVAEMVVALCHEEKYQECLDLLGTVDEHVLRDIDVFHSKLTCLRELGLYADVIELGEQYRHYGHGLTFGICDYLGTSYTAEGNYEKAYTYLKYNLDASRGNPNFTKEDREIFQKKAMFVYEKMEGIINKRFGTEEAELSGARGGKPPNECKKKNKRKKRK